MFIYMVVAPDTLLDTSCESFKFFQVVTKNPIRARMFHPLGKGWKITKKNDGSFTWTRRDENGNVQLMKSDARSSWIDANKYKQLKVFKVCRSDSNSKILKRAGLVNKYYEGRIEITHFLQETFPVASGTVITVGLLKI